MRSEAADADAYLAGVPEERRAALVKLRALCVETLHGYTEGMEYGMPFYKAPGGAVKAYCTDQVAFASQRQYISLYGLGRAAERHQAELGGNVGKGCIRFSKPEKMDFALIRQMLEEVAAS